MIRPTPPPLLDPAVRGSLALLRGKIRRYVTLETVARAVVWLGAMFWFSLAVDWSCEPARAVRMAILGLVAAGMGVVVWRYGLRRLLRPLRDRSMAMLLERRFPELGESLVTAVELCRRPDEQRECHPQLLAQTCRQAAVLVQRVEPSQVLNPTPLRRSLVAAAALALSVVLFGLAAPEAMSVWARRNLAMSNQLWPRRTRLVIEGFPDGEAKVPRGADLKVIVKADLTMPRVPRRVEIRYRTEGGVRVREPMTRVGLADLGRERFQEFSYTFRSVLAPVRFDVVGGDDAIRGLQIQVVDRPAVVQMFVDCRYPDYMGRSERSQPVTGVMQIPVGTRVRVRAVANKPLRRVEVERASTRSPCPPRTVRPGPGSNRRFQYDVGVVEEDQSWLFQLYDTDGITSRQPIRLALAAVPDQPPELAVQLRGIGAAITPQARLPVEGTVRDDYGVARVWFHYQLSDGQAAETEVAAYDARPTEIEVNPAFEVSPLALRPGDKLLFGLKAADACQLGEGPNVGSSPTWPLDVVTASQLRNLLEARELVLRERLQAIAHQLRDTRASLESLAFAPPESESRTSRPPGAEPGDATAQPDDPGLRLTRLSLAVQRAQQNSRKEAQEVLGVAEGIDQIRLELINNRIDTEQLKLRLEQQIAGPLHHVAEVLFPELDRRLKRLESALADAQGASLHRQSAVQQLDVILQRLDQVLARMIELEDFNQAIALLEQIIEEQEQLIEATKRKRKEKLRELLEP